MDLIKIAPTPITDLAADSVNAEPKSRASDQEIRKLEDFQMAMVGGGEPMVCW